MELKIVCDCGQKFKFEVEPVNGQMPFAVTCPGCGSDRTAAANIALAQNASTSQQTSVGGLRINHPPPPIASAEISRPIASIQRPPGAITPGASSSKPGEFNLGLGILGAFMGAIAGAGLMHGFYQWAGFRFPLLGIGIGALTGFGAKLLYKGTDHALGVISAVISLVSVVGTLWLMYGEFPIMSVISVAISAAVAYRIAG